MTVVHARTMTFPPRAMMSISRFVLRNWTSIVPTRSLEEYFLNLTEKVE